MYAIKQSSTAYPLVFLIVQSADHITGLTGAAPTVTLSKAGGTFAAVTGAVSEIGSGWYKVAGNATDTATLGPLALHSTVASGDPTDVMYEVVAYDPQDTVRLGLTALPNAAAQASGGLYTRGTGAGQINQDANGRVDINAVAWLGGTIAAVSATGVPKVDINNWLGNAVLALISQRVQCIVGAYDTGQAPLQPTVAGNTLDVSATGEAGLDFSNIKDATGAHTLTNITVPVTTAVTNGVTVTTNNDKTGYALSTAGVQAIWDALTSALTTAGSVGKLLVDNITASIAAVKAKTDNLPSSPAAVGSTMKIDLTQAVATSNTAETVGDALNAARAQGFGKWALVGTTLSLYANDGTTVVRSFTLDSATTPTSRT